MISSIFPILFFIFVVWLFISLCFYTWGYTGIHTDEYNEERTKTNWNLMALFFNIKQGHLKPSFKIPSKIERDIRKELKKIKKEQAEVKSMKKLTSLIDYRVKLENEKESLFNEVDEKQRYDN